jgi:hypothetical protein
MVCANRGWVTDKPEVTTRTTALNWKSKFSTHNPTHSKTYSRKGSRYLLARTTMPRCYITPKLSRTQIIKRKEVVRPAGFEPTTSCLEAARVILPNLAHLIAATSGGK